MVRTSKWRLMGMTHEALKDITYHFSSTRRKSFLCPYRFVKPEKDCYLGVSLNDGFSGCVFGK